MTNQTKIRKKLCTFMLLLCVKLRAIIKLGKFLDVSTMIYSLFIKRSFLLDVLYDILRFIEQLLILIKVSERRRISCLALSKWQIRIATI